jgi:hypothetical protein
VLVAFGDNWTGSWWSLNEFAIELSKNRDRLVLAAPRAERHRCQFDLAHRLLNELALKLFSKQKETLTFHFQLDSFNEHSHSVNDSTQLVEI